MQQQFHKWIYSLIRYGDNPNNYLHWRVDKLTRGLNGEEDYVGLVVFYTRTFSYSIKARVDHGQPGYLGCIASARKPLAGEVHTRGNDLADGHFTEATWQRIIADILCYEMVKIVKDARRTDDVVK